MIAIAIVPKVVIGTGRLEVVRKANPKYNGFYQQPHPHWSDGFGWSACQGCNTPNVRGQKLTAYEQPPMFLVESRPPLVYVCDRCVVKLDAALAQAKNMVQHIWQ